MLGVGVVRAACGQMRNTIPAARMVEFDTFVFGGPIFDNPVKFAFGELVCRNSFWFCDLSGWVALLERGFSMFGESGTTTPVLSAA